MSMSLPNMNILPYIGDESGSQLVPEPSRLIGSARSMVECISICIAWLSCEGANRERRRTDKDKNPFLHVGCMFSVVAAVSAATACANASGTAAATAKDSRPRKLSGLVRLERAEREREGSAAKSIQRTNAH